MLRWRGVPLAWHTVLDAIPGWHSMGMLDAGGVLPRMDDVAEDRVNADAMLHLREDEWSAAAHPFRVPSHHFEVRAHARGQIRLVDYEQVRLGNAGAAFAWNFVATANVDDLNRVVSQLAAETGGQIIAAGFDEQDIRLELPMQFFECEQIGGNVLSNGRMWTAARFHCANAVRIECAVLDQKLTVLFRENVVCHRGDAHLLAEPSAKLQHQGSFAAAHRTSDANREGAPVEVAAQWQIAFVIMPGMVEGLMRMAVAALFVTMTTMKENSAHNPLLQLRCHCCEGIGTAKENRLKSNGHAVMKPS